VLKKAGVEGKPVMLFIEDYQILDPAYLEYINSLLSGGEVPGLFTTEELAKELMPLEGIKNNDSSYSGPPTLYAYFTHRCEFHTFLIFLLALRNAL
jgi:dynein heavy chain 2